MWQTATWNSSSSRPTGVSMGAISIRYIAWAKICWKRLPWLWCEKIRHYIEVVMFRCQYPRERLKTAVSNRTGDTVRGFIMSPPLYTDVGTCWFTFVRSVHCPVRLSSGFHGAVGFYCAVASCPSKHETLTQCWANVGPPSTTLSQH